MTFLGQSVKDPNPVWLLEFWNRSLTKVWSLDGTAPGPGATATPDLKSPDGMLTNPDTGFVLVTPGVDIAGRPLGEPTGDTPAPARRTAAAPNGPDGGLSRWLDGAISELYPVRRPAWDTRARPRQTF